MIIAFDWTSLGTGGAVGAIIVAALQFITKTRSADLSELWREIAYLRTNLEAERIKSDDCAKKSREQQVEIDEMRQTIAWLHGAMGVMPSSKKPFQFPRDIEAKPEEPKAP